jgi:hypothetical protein
MSTIETISSWSAAFSRFRLVGPFLSFRPQDATTLEAL